MDRILVKLPKGVEFYYGERDYITKRDYYTTVVPKNFGDLHEIAKKASHNIQKQIAQEMGFIGSWQIVNFYDKFLEMEFKS